MISASITGMTDAEIIQNYHAHGECEQYHSEIKMDMGVEHLTSVRFETNELLLELTIIACSMLRMHYVAGTMQQEDLSLFLMNF